MVSTGQISSFPSILTDGDINNHNISEESIDVKEISTDDKFLSQPNLFESGIICSSKQFFADVQQEPEEKKEEDELPPYFPSSGLTQAEAEELLKLHGRNEILDKVKPGWLIYLELLIQPMPIMIWIAIIVEIAILNWMDMGILLAIQFINSFIGYYELNKAGNAVAALKNSLKPQANVKRDGKWINIESALCVPGDLVLLVSGAAVPADCVINEGRIDIDMSCMTGESLPVSLGPREKAFMGATAVQGEVEATVFATGMHTFFGTTANLLNNENESSNLQKQLINLMIVLVIMSLAWVAAVFIFLMVKLGAAEWRDVLSFSVVVIVASIPIAIEIVTTATLAIGARTLSSEGAIVTRLAAIEELAGMNVLCSDKTGTLTLNKMVIQEEAPTYTEGYDQYELIQASALATRWNEPPKDALDTLVLTNADIEPLSDYKQLDYVPFNPSTKRTEGTVLQLSTNKVFRISKGAPTIIANLILDKAVRHSVLAKVDDYASRGIRSLAVARCDALGEYKKEVDENNKEVLSDETKFSDWYMLGIFTFLDPARPDSKQTIENALRLGVDVKMLTGDSALIAQEVCKSLGMGHTVGDNSLIPALTEDGKPPKDAGEIMGDALHENDAYAGIYPEHKYVLVEAFRQQGYATGMTGDGVNDAPALKRADVGIAVAGATDAARAAADIVLTKEGLSVLISGLYLSREIFKRIQSFINYRIAATLQLLYFFVLEVFIFRPQDYATHPLDIADGVAPGFYFQLPVLLLMIITVLNDGALISIGYDNATASQKPDKWNLGVLWTISIALGSVACGSSLLLLWLCLDSNNPEGVLESIGIGGLRWGQIVTAIYLKVSISDFLTLFSSRTQESFFFQSVPGWPLALGASISLFISTMIACFLPRTVLQEVQVEGLAIGENKLLALWIWIYCIFWWFVQDTLKVITFWVLQRYDFFGKKTKSKVNARIVTTVDNSHITATGRTEIRLLIRKIDDCVSTCEEAVINFKGIVNARKIKGMLKNVINALNELKDEIMMNPAQAISPGGFITQFATVGSKDKKRRKTSKSESEQQLYGDDERVTHIRSILLELTKVHWHGSTKQDVVEKLKACLESLEEQANEVVETLKYVNEDDLATYPSFMGGIGTSQFSLSQRASSAAISIAESYSEVLIPLNINKNNSSDN